MSKDINIELGITSINEAIKQLKAYKLKIVRRNRSLVYHLMEAGWYAAESAIASAATDYPDIDRKVSYKRELPNTNFRGNVVEGQFILNSKDIMFWEFGAVIHYNTAVDTSPHPKASDYGKELGGMDVTIGNYSHGINGHSLGQFDSWHVGGTETHGTEAAMPIYNAWRYMSQKYVKLAGEIMTKGNLNGE